MKTFFTTGDVAKVCEIAQKTVVNYCNGGLLESQQSTITHYRRIPRDVLIRFMREHQIPMERLNLVDEKNILIVDDEEQSRALLSEVISTRVDSAEVTTAEDGYEALIRVGASPPDLILLDIMMPGMDGVEVVRRLRDNLSTQRIGVIAISASQSKNIEKSALSAGADLFMRKPVDVDVLVHAVESLLKIGRKT